MIDKSGLDAAASALTREFSLLAGRSVDDVVAWTDAGPRSVSRLLLDSAAIARRIPDIEPSREILVLCADRYHFVAALLAVWQRGRAVALPPHTQPNTIRDIMHGAAIHTLLHDGTAERGLDVRTCLDSEEPPADLAGIVSRLSIRAERRIATVYTSGSTGERQACRKTAQQLLGEATSLGHVFRIGPGDRVLATVPSHHIYGLLTGVLLPLTSGASFVAAAPLYPDEVVECIRRHRATVLASVPAHLRGLAGVAEKQPSTLRRILSSGAPLDQGTARALTGFTPDVFEILGASETGGMAWRRPDSEQRWHPMPGVHIVADPEGRMLVDSPFLDPETPRPLAGGDCIEPAGDGTFTHLGRIDGVVKVGGKRISVAEVEQKLRQLEGVQDAAVTAVPVQGGRGNELWAVVVAPTLDRQTIRHHLSQWFDPIALPRRIRVVDSLPREATGKLTKERLMKLFDGPEIAGGAATAFEILNRTRQTGETNRVEISLRVPRDLQWFRGHFDGFPILAGVVIMNNLVVPECRLAWPDLQSVRQISGLKFHSPIRPGDGVVLRLQRSPTAARVSFEAWSDNRFCNSGSLSFGGLV
jgi:acyl-coenzyme A synthetase/AMP-(fatty) acid ligase